MSLFVNEAVDIVVLVVVVVAAAVVAAALLVESLAVSNTS